MNCKVTKNQLLRVMRPIGFSLVATIMGTMGCSDDDGGSADPKMDAGMTGTDATVVDPNAVEFTDLEKIVISGMSPLGTPPPNPTNKYGDLPEASLLGRLLFWDTTIAGSIQTGTDYDAADPDGNTGDDSYFPGQEGPWNANGGTPLALGPVGEDMQIGCQGCHNGKWGADERGHAYWPLSLATKWHAHNTPAMANVAFYDCFTLDCHADSLWQLSLGAYESGGVTNGSRLQAAHRIYSTYKAEYEAMVLAGDGNTTGDGITVVDSAMVDISGYPARGKPGSEGYDGMTENEKEVITRIAVNFGKAMAAYERTLISGNSDFDKYVAGDEAAISLSAKRGLKLFVSKANCSSCHRGPAMTDNKLYNIGVPQGYANTGVHHDKATDEGLYNGLGKVLTGGFNQESVWSDDPTGEGKVRLDRFRALEVAGGCDAAVDPVGCAITDSDLNLGKFRTSILRNIAGTGPYFHNGSAATLRDVVEHYNVPPTDNSTGFSGTIDANIKPLNLTSAEIDDLVAFLKTLTGEPLTNYSPVGVQ